MIQHDRSDNVTHITYNVCVATVMGNLVVFYGLPIMMICTLWSSLRVNVKKLLVTVSTDFHIQNQ